MTLLCTCVCVCVCLPSRFSSHCTRTFLPSSSARQPSTTPSVEWAPFSNSCIRWSTTTGPSTPQTAAASHRRVSVSVFSFSSFCFAAWRMIWFDLSRCLYKWLSNSVWRLQPSEAQFFEKAIIGTGPITIIVGCHELGSLLKWQRQQHLPHVWKWLIPTLRRLPVSR